MTTLLRDARQAGLKFQLQVGLPLGRDRRQTLTAESVVLADRVRGAAEHDCPCCGGHVNLYLAMRTRLRPWVVGWCPACVGVGLEVGPRRALELMRESRHAAGNAVDRKITVLAACEELRKRGQSDVRVDEFGVVLDDGRRDAG
jgi:hypothetical protein